MSELNVFDLADFVRGQVRKGMPPFIAYAVTTGDAATADTVGTITTSQVTVWLDGAPQTPENKTTATLLYGQAAPAAGQLWMALLPNCDRAGAVLAYRLA